MSAAPFTKDELEFGLRFFALGRNLFSTRAIKDAVLWHDKGGRLCVAWVMEPLAMRALVAAVDEERDGIQSMRVDYSLRSAFGPMRYSDFNYGGTVDGGNDLLSRLGNTLGSLDLMEGQPESPFVTLIPEGGWPWPAQDGVFFSAKAKKLVPSRKPEWLIEVPAKESIGREAAYGVDLCMLMGAVPVDGIVDGLGDAMVARFPAEDIIVTHAVSARGGESSSFASESLEQWEAAGRSVRSCGGLLFPSLAVGPVPATNFGSCVLIARAGMALQGVKPYRPRGKILVWLYDTDAWTGRVGDYAEGWATSAFNQMHGHSDYMYSIDTNVWTLGAPGGMSLSGGPAIPTPIETLKKLNSELAKRFKVWKRDLTPEQVQKVQAKVALTQARYAYLEAKVNGLTPMDAYPIAVCPKRHKRKFSAFLDAAGWDGRLEVLDVPDDIMDAAEDTEWMDRHVPYGTPGAMDRRQAIETWAAIQYGWHVAEAVRRIGPTVEVKP